MIAQQGRQKWLALVSDPGVRKAAAVAGYGLGGFCMSAAGIASRSVPLAMGLTCALTGWRALVTALGSLLGYICFWGTAGNMGVTWSVGGCLIALFLGKRREVQTAGMLLPALAAFWVSATGLLFQMLLGDGTPVPIYMLRVVLAGASAALYTQARKEAPMAEHLAKGTAVLALAQIAPFGFSLGYPAAGILGAGGALPAAALAGLALDLARVAQVPMTGAMCLAWFLRQLPAEKKWIRCFSPGVAYLTVMILCGGQDLRPLPGLVIGGVLSVLLPGETEPRHRKGEVGLAQVRLEIMAGVLSQTQQLLLEVPPVPVDEEGVLARTRERACGSCPVRKQCQESAKLSVSLLHIPLNDTAAMPCRKPSRLLLELRRSQEQLRSLHADRERRREYRQAVIQQYQFLGDLLRDLSDRLPRHADRVNISFRVDAEILSCGKEDTNGDKCQCFDGTGGNYYIVLCDGMGTGMGAAQEGQTALSMLKKMLTAGFPAEHALRSINSICCLRGRAGAVTVDLAEVSLETGKTVLYKWGAAPSWVLGAAGAEKVGTAGPPPGLSVTQTRETVERLSLRRGEVLILMSDGVDGEGAMHRVRIAPGEPLGEIAAKLLESGWSEGADDATVAAIRLHPVNLST